MTSPPVTPHLRKPQGRRRTLAQIDKDNKTLSLHLQGKKHREIMVEQGYKSMASVTYAIKRALLERQKDAFEQMDHFTVAVESIQHLIAENEAIVAATHYAVSSTGKIVLGPDGNPLVDDGPKQRALTELRHLRGELAKLLGTYAPTKSRQEVVTQDVVDRENEQFVQEIQKLSREMERGGEAAHPGVIREP